jgi:NAD(P)-dependent dehydrogenase (short-subunit alcohol dehydrogenase family)
LDLFSLEGKTALVTGASRGIGEAIALAFAAQGADVALAARSVDDLERVAKEIEAMGRRAVVIPCDVSEASQCDTAVERTVNELDRLDILVNNAGGTRFMAPLTETRRDGWSKAIALNLDSVFYFCQTAGKIMTAQGTGSVINVSSVAGVGAAPGLSYYAAAKHGVIGITKTCAVEWAMSGVRCNALAPGWVKTDLNKLYWSNPETERAFVQMVPMQRWGNVDEITGAAIFLASDASSYVTGQTLLIDGGVTAN